MKILPLILAIFAVCCICSSAAATMVYFSWADVSEFLGLSKSPAPAAVLAPTYQTVVAPTPPNEPLATPPNDSPPPMGNFTTFWKRLFKGADPMAFVHDGTWYVFSTGPVAYSSADGGNTWKRHDGVLNDGFIWAPHVHQVGGDWYMFYSTGPTPLRVAKSSSKSPLGPYVKHAEFGAFLIDPYLVADDDGTWILFATDSNPKTNGGIFRTVIQPDMKTIGPWKRVFGPKDDPTSGGVTEGTNFFRTAEGWVAAYSSNPYTTPLYDTRTAFAPSLDGPWKFHGRKLVGPISKNGQMFSGIGHGSYVSLGENEYVYFLHTHDSGPDDRSIFAIRATLENTTMVYHVE